MKRLILTALTIFFVLSLFSQEKVYNLYFEINQAILSSEQKEELSNLIYDMEQGKTISIFPLTYDSLFEQYKYAKIANKQAQEIANYAKTIGFELKGIPKNLPSGYNGRSVCVILKKISEPPVLSNNHFPEKPSQFFLIDPKKDTMIIGNEGTKLLFDAGCLLTPNKVNIELKEFYSLEDYIKGDLPTVSNGKMLLTGGVIYLNATENTPSKKQVKINQEKGIDVDFVMDNNDSDMQIFIKDPRSKKEMNWVLPTKKAEDWQMTENVLDENGTIVSKKTYYSKKEWEEHLKEKERIKKEKEKVEQERIKKEKLLAKSDNFLTVNNFGFINCDRFPNEPLISLFVSTEDTENTKYYLVFSETRSVMNGHLMKNKNVNFSKVPKNKKALIIAMKFTEKQAYYYSDNILTGEANYNKIKLNPVSEEFINQQLKIIK